MANIEHLVAETIALRRHGEGLRGACPIHPDEPMSLHVDGGRGVFRCFSCRWEGDALAWVMRRDGVTEEEAIEILADRDRSTRDG